MELPDSLKILWAGEQYGAVHLNVNGMTSIVMKMPRAEAESFRAARTLARLELHRHPAAPVFRMYFEFQDQPGSPFAGDTFFNIMAELDKQNLALLAAQDELVFHFFAAEDDQYIYSKTINWRETQRRQAKSLMLHGENHLKTIRRPDYTRALAEVQNQTKWE